MLNSIKRETAQCLRPSSRTLTSTWGSFTSCNVSEGHKRTIGSFGYLRAKEDER